MRKYYLIAGLIILLCSAYKAQTADSASSEIPDSLQKMQFSGYIEMYYAIDADHPTSQVTQPFLYNHVRRNEFALNLGMFRASYNTKNVRGNLSLMVGNYAEYNLASEPGIFRNVYESSVGLRVTKHIWLDAGVFPSHIGAESAIGKDNFTVTRSLIAENSPYYETGVKISYDKGKKWTFTLVGVNGWQNIRDNNVSKAAGWQIIYKPNSKISFSSSSFAGNEKADTAKQYRLFHNLIVNWNPGKKFAMIVYVDAGFEQVAKADTVRKGWNPWHGISVMGRLSLWKKVDIGMRVEEYWDKYGVIVSGTTANPVTGTSFTAKNGFQVEGASVNLDWHPYPKVLFRTEVKYLKAQENVFLTQKGFVDTKIMAISALMITF